MQYVDDVLNAKGRDVYTATPTTTVFEALELMADKEVGALVVVHKDRLVGIFPSGTMLAGWRWRVSALVRLR